MKNASIFAVCFLAVWLLSFVWLPEQLDNAWADADGTVLLAAAGDDDAAPLPLAPKNDVFETTDLEALVMKPLENDSRPKGCELKLRVVSQPDYGWVINNNDGSLTYIPQEGVQGETDFRYEICCNDRCESALVNLSVKEEHRCHFEKWEVPAVISPNGDGVDDRFEIEALQLCWQNGHFKLSIFDEAGTLVYHNDDYSQDQSWMAVNNIEGGLVLSGSYYYVLEQVLGTSNRKKSGFVEVVR
ncbi:gliding motility-associated C-terminal domain-containing protein [Chitinophagales bacterium]|nr:gliding motility-associated C-terminal domain-containing protein [Chitinophagales bacterium]